MEKLLWKFYLKKKRLTGIAPMQHAARRSRGARPYLMDECKLMRTAVVAAIVDDPDFRPLIQSPHLSGTEPVGMVLQKLRDGQYFIPAYQREDLQWSREKQSLLMDSILNGVLLPAIIVAPYQGNGEEICEVVDGQQRLTTLLDFVDGLYALAPVNKVNYTPNLVKHAGKKFHELPLKLQRFILNYALTITRLAPNLTANQRMTTFRRINEENRTLSDMELRAGEFATTARGWFFRVVGVRDPESRSGRRLLRFAQEHEVHLPWRNLSDWSGWWGDSRLAGGATPAETFLSYVVARIDPEIMKSIIYSKDLKLRYDKLTATVYDMVMERFQYEDTHPGATKLLPELETLQSWFRDFETWFHAVRRHALSVTPAAARKVAFFIAAAASIWEYPERLRDEHWKLVSQFLRKAPKDVRALLRIEYKVAKGYWPGLADQILYTYQACEAVVARLTDPDEEICQVLQIEKAQSIKLRSKADASKLAQERIEQEKTELLAPPAKHVEDPDADDNETEAPSRSVDDAERHYPAILAAVEDFQNKQHANPTAAEIVAALAEVESNNEELMAQLQAMIEKQLLIAHGSEQYLQPSHEHHEPTPADSEEATAEPSKNKRRRRTGR